VADASGIVLENLAPDLIKPTLSRAELYLFELGKLQHILGFLRPHFKFGIFLI